MNLITLDSTFSNVQMAFIGKFSLKENQTPRRTLVHNFFMPIDRGNSKTYIYKVLEKFIYPFFYKALKFKKKTKKKLVIFLPKNNLGQVVGSSSIK